MFPDDWLGGILLNANIVCGICFLPSGIPEGK